MNLVLHLVLAVAMLIVAVWCLIFGGVGALLARLLARRPATGFLLGTLFGPVGWLAVVVSGRRTRRATDLETPTARSEGWDAGPQTSGGGHVF